MKQLRETYHDKQHKILIDKQKNLLIDSSANKLKVFQDGIKEINKRKNNFNSW